MISSPTLLLAIRRLIRSLSRLVLVQVIVRDAAERACGPGSGGGSAMDRPPVATAAAMDNASRECTFGTPSVRLRSPARPNAHRATRTASTGPWNSRSGSDLAGPDPDRAGDGADAAATAAGAQWCPAGALPPRLHTSSPTDRVRNPFPYRGDRTRRYDFGQQPEHPQVGSNRVMGHHPNGRHRTRNSPAVDSGRGDRGSRVRFTRKDPTGIDVRPTGIHLAAAERSGSPPLIERSPGGRSAVRR